MNEQLTIIVAALLSGQNYSTVSKEVIEATVESGRGCLR